MEKKNFKPKIPKIVLLTVRKRSPVHDLVPNPGPPDSATTRWLKFFLLVSRPFTIGPPHVHIAPYHRLLP